jgi:polyphosphate glucokinase
MSAEPPPRLALGIDIGGTGIKAAVVDVSGGRLVTDRLRVETPKPGHPDEVANALKQLIEPLQGDGHYDAVGVGFPSVIKAGVAMTAVNLSDTWCFEDVAAILGEAVGHEVSVLNDADAAGLAEVRFGAGQGVAGTVVVVTLGTGVGTSLFVDGRLVPNMELAQMQVRGKHASERVSNSAREKKKLTWEDWTADVQEFLELLDAIVWPEMIIIGGGVSSESRRFMHKLKVRPVVMPARLRNEAGIIGAALHAYEVHAITI